MIYFGKLNKWGSAMKRNLSKVALAGLVIYLLLGIVYCACLAAVIRWRIPDYTDATLWQYFTAQPWPVMLFWPWDLFKLAVLRV